VRSLLHGAIYGVKRLWISANEGETAVSVGKITFRVDVVYLFPKGLNHFLYPGICFAEIKAGYTYKRNDYSSFAERDKQIALGSLPKPFLRFEHIPFVVSRCIPAIALIRESFQAFKLGTIADTIRHGPATLSLLRRKTHCAAIHGYYRKISP